MKNLYPKNKNKDKGKVYPSPNSSSFSPPPPPNYADAALSMLNLLPATILTLASVLSLQDREVLGYLITRSMKTTNPNSNSISNPSSSSLNKCKKTSNNTHKPLFDCDCFDCYTSYWFRWDSSPNRELIHQVIEAFEEYLTKGELNKNNNNNGTGRGGKKKDKMGRRGGIDKPPVVDNKSKRRLEQSTPEKILVLPMLAEEPKKLDDIVLPVVEENKEEYEVCEATEEVTGGEVVEELPAGKGLVSKVFPDVMGILNSRIWSLWSPNV